MGKTVHSTKLDLSEGNVLGIRLQGRVTEEDYREFLPEMETIIEEHGSIRLLLELKGIQGISPGALWEDLKFDVKHFRDYERLALVGDEQWEKSVATLSKPFVEGEVEFFPPEKLREAWVWIKA
jgi:hypothetical protein